MAHRLPSTFSFPNWNWLGLNLRVAIDSIGGSLASLPRDKIARHGVMLYGAAVQDASEQAQNGQHRHAANSLHVAIVVVKRSNFLGEPQFLDLINTYGENLLKANKIHEAYLAASALIEIQPKFFRGYMLMSRAVSTKGDLATSTTYLMKGMVACNLSSDEIVFSIATCSLLLGKVKMDLLKGVLPQKDIVDLMTMQLQLPKQVDIWSTIAARLITEKQFVGLAFLTGIFQVVGPPLTCLEGACPFDVDCSTAHVEDLYDSLAPEELALWGDSLAMYIVGHKGNIGKRTKDPLGVHLVKLSLKYGTCNLLKCALETQSVEWICPEHTDDKGDSALHVAVKWSPFTTLNEELIFMLTKHGVLPNIKDRCGKIPSDYLPSSQRKSMISKLLSGIMETTTEAFKERIESLKNEGNQAFRAKETGRAIEAYTHAVSVIEQSSYNMPRECAILCNNMAAVFASLGDTGSTYIMTSKSITFDPTYHKPYWRQGKLLIEQSRNREACEKFLQGMVCSEVDNDQKTTFIVETVSALHSLSDKEATQMMNQLMPHLNTCWPKVVESLTNNSSWDSIRRLVLGPPEFKPVDQTLIQAGWKFSDRHKAGTVKVGYAMSLKASTPALHTLVAMVEKLQPAGVVDWATDLVLALMLQGARPESLLTKEDENTSWYHVALSLCCLTEKLGLMYYILSDESRVGEARSALNQEKRTLLHTACLHFGDGEKEMGKQLVRLLLDKGINPATADSLRKTAADYVAPHSSICNMLQNSSGSASLSAEEIKEQGNEQFKKKNFKQALHLYSQAIAINQKKLTPQMMLSRGHEKKKHELAVLFSNRAECHLLLGNIEQASQDARESVGYDGQWYRGHIRMGRVLLRKKKVPQALKAFSNAFHALGIDATEIQKKETLKELVKTINTHKDAAQKTDKIPDLGYVARELWALVSYDFFCSGNDLAERQDFNSARSDWMAAIIAFSQLEKDTTEHFTPPHIEVNLKRLCCLQIDQEAMTANSRLIFFFLMCGSDLTTLSYFPGDTYIHAAVCLTVLSLNLDVLNFVMEHRAKPFHEENLQDQEGNTALHVIATGFLLGAMPHQLPNKLHFQLVKILLDWGVNPKVKNKFGMVAINFVDQERNRPVYNLLLKAMKNARDPETQAQKPSSNGSAKSQQTTSKASQAAGTGQSAGASKKHPAVEKTEGMRQLCQTCEDNIAEAKEYFSKQEKTRIAYSKIVSIFSQKHDRDSRHEKFVKEGLDLIVQELGNSLIPEIPDVLLKISESHLHLVLQMLALKGKWRQLEVVVEKFRASDVPRGRFGSKMSVLDLLRDKGLRGAEVQRLQILNLLLAHGAELPEAQRAKMIEAVVQHGEWRLVERLVELGVEPKFLTLSKDDTPLHAALSVALDKDKGNNFSLFDQLVSLYEKDPDKYSYLKLSSVDKKGNTLLHLACNTHYTKHSHRAVELLMSKDVPVDVKNKDGKAAIDFLKSHDRRTQYLRVAGKTSTVSARKKTDGAVGRMSPPVAVENGAAPKVKDSRNQKTQEMSKVEADNDAKVTADKLAFKTKDAMSLLNSLVDDLCELTPAEAKLGKSSKGKWLEKRTTRSDIRNSDSEEEGGATASPAPGTSGDAYPMEGLVQDSEDEIDKKDEMLVEGEAEEEIDLLTFDNLEWEVDCTVDVWKTLRDQNIPYILKKRIVRSIKFLASGEWRHHLCRKVHHVPANLNLHQAKFVKGARILWELAIAFSPRLSDAAEKRIDEVERKGEFAVRGGRIYTEIIRVWDIVFHPEKLKPAIQRIIQSHQKGEHCLIHKELKGVKSQQFMGSSVKKRLPMLFSETDETKMSALQSEEDSKLELYPPASASKMEFHILKFYCFSSALVYNVLKNLEMKIDFPFRVTDREHAVINLQSRAPLLLLGRSGTGKTTCCLYRLWSRFLVYWTKAKEMGYDAWLPRTVQYTVEDIDDQTEEQEEDPNAELFKGLLDKEGREGEEEAGSKGRGTAAAAAGVSASAASRPARSSDSSTSAASHRTRFSSDSKAATKVQPHHEDVMTKVEREEGEQREEEDDDDDKKEKEEEGEGKVDEDEEGADCLAAEGSNEQYDHLHQLFVTKNQVLCSEVQKNFRELCHASDVAQHHVDVEEAALPHRLQDMDEYKFPLFLTSRQLILMLDASLPAPHFFERNEDGSLRVTIQGWGADEEIFAFVPLDDDSDEEDEREYGSEGEEDAHKEEENQAAADHRPRKKDNRREVTYQVFAHEIWPKITKKAQVTYHPSLVWTEIMSFIKGSFASLAQRKGYLDKDSYEQLGRKQAPNFTGSRDKVYELFLRYADYKRQHGLYDEADLVFDIFKRLKAAGPLPWVLHEVFVDETQDFTQAELTVLIRLAHNPNDMFLTGDTAQSIMRGVSFRFSDLKTLFHYAKQSLKARGKTGMLEVPKQVYQLTHNYRSHAGILSLASAVLDLLVEFFPESFDRLQKDQGLFDGPQPVVLESGSPADLAILLSGNRRKTSHIEFGAHQVILVVNEEARNSLPEELGMGLVLTIYEAKGLEFDDVLLYNFFKDSQASKEWRVVTEFLERLAKGEDSSSNSNDSGLVEIDEDVLQQTGRPRPLNFNPNLHKILNSELKHLYTAVTRARVNVWIFDQDAEKRAPMFEYFKARKLVKFVSIKEGDDEEGGVSQSMFAEKSGPEEWEKRGDEIMLRSLYDVAAKCYAMAGATWKEKIAIAHQSALKASQLRAQPRQMREAFLKAAIMFLECHEELSLSPSTLPLRFNLVTKAGRCLQNARLNNLAALVFDKNGQPELAGPLYLQARKWLAASQCFERVDNFRQALKILSEQELYDQAIDCLQRYNIRTQDFVRKGLPLPRGLIEHKPDGSCNIANLGYKAAKFYYRYGETEKMLAAIERLPEKEAQIKFLQKHGFLKNAALLMCAHGRSAEAARMMLHNGEIDQATSIAEEENDSALKAQCYLLKAQQLIRSKTKKKKMAEKSNKPAGNQTAAGTDHQDKPYDQTVIKQISETTGHPEAEVAKVLQDVQGDTDQAIFRLIEDEPSDYETRPSRSGKNKEEYFSSEEDEDNGSQLQVEGLLKKAIQQYELCNDSTGIGECLLMLGQLQQDKDILAEAIDRFVASQPATNLAGILECVEQQHKIGSCFHLSQWVEGVFEIVRILLNPSTPEEKTKYQVYLTFYGLVISGEGKLLFHPKLNPRCIDMVGKKQLFSTKEDKKMETLYKPQTEVVVGLASHLIRRTKEWCKELEFHLNKDLPAVTKCSVYTLNVLQSGQTCPDMDFCPYLHDTYTQELSYKAINTMCKQIHLDFVVQVGAESLLTANVKLSELAQSLKPNEKQWTSIETLLDFIFPSELVTYNMSAVLGFCVSVAGKARVRVNVHKQIERYLQYLWDNPGRVGKGKSNNVLKERCKSTNWMVLASLLVPLFHLNIKVDESCKKLEMELDKKRPDWMRKRHKYALLMDKNMVILMARRHLDALRFLQPSEFNPFEALIKFTKFVKLLFDRWELGQMPDMPMFLFWLEIFATLALFLAVKLRGNGHFFLPACYTRMLKLFNLTLPNAQKGDFQQLLEEWQPSSRSMTLELLHQRIEILVMMLCGSQSSPFSLVKQLLQPRKKTQPNFLLAERSLVLALTMLINVEQNNVGPRCEASIMRCVSGFQSSLIEAAPPRLSELIRQVQQATDYGHIRQGLDQTLSSMGEHGNFYRWLWNRQDREGFQQIRTSAVQTGGSFRVFRPDSVALARGQAPEVIFGTVDDIDEGTAMDIAVEEEEIDEEEKAIIQQQRNEAKQQAVQQKASIIILRFMRSIMFKRHMKRLKSHCVQQIERNLFSLCELTPQMCGICGVSFEINSDNRKEPPPATEMEENIEEKTEEDEKVAMAKMRQAHMISEEHRNMHQHFHSFHEIYRSRIGVPLIEIGAFLSKYEVKKQKESWYKEYPYEIDSVLEKFDTLQHELNQAIQERRWTERQGLVEKARELVAFFKEKVQVPVQKIFDNLQEQQTQKKAAKKAEQQHQEKMMEGFVEDPEMTGILKVVDQPHQKAGPNLQGAWARGGGRGAWTNRRRGRSHSGYRDRDGHYRGQRQGWQGHRMQKGQYETGDLPPRMSRQQHRN